VVVANCYGINTIISNSAGQFISPTYKLVSTQTQEIIAASQVPISFEFLFFAAFFCFMILLEYGINTLADFSLAITFAGIFGLLFTIDELYPGNFTPLLIFVPVTATLAAKVLTLMGYHTVLYFTTNMTTMPLLIATNRYGSFAATIDWTCAGVESLLIYTVMILLFLRKTVIPWAYRVIYFVIGAAVTYFINSLRIAYLFILGIEYGGNSLIWQNFHNDYAMLISIGWIVSYLLIIVGSQALWGKIKNRKTDAKKAVNFQTKAELSE
jgi:thaumarchaeosortase